MVQKLLDRIQAKLELFRLEQRYTRRRNRRSTFVSNAVYVDGEYVYQTPNPTGSSTDSSMSRIDALHGEQMSVGPGTAPIVATLAPMESETPTVPQRKRLNRFSSMPAFGGHFSSKDKADISARRTSAIQW